MSSVKLAKFLKGKLEGVNPIRDVLNNDAFFSPEISGEENLVAMNADFLKSHPDIQILPVEEIFTILEELAGREIKRE